MKAAAASARTRLDAELALQVACHEWLVAIDTGAIERIALDDTFTPRADGQSGAPAGFLGVLRSEHREYAAWDLATLVGREPERGAWVLVRIADGSADPLPIALRTGACRLVGKLPESTLSRLPQALCGVRRRPFRGAFLPTAAQTGAAKGAVAGVALDLQRLFLSEELEWSRRALTTRSRRGER
jgi:hypothetical protein